MAAIRVETFSGSPNQNVKTFIKSCRYAFLGTAHHYPDGEEREQARIMLLITNTTGEARNYIDNLEDAVSEDWNALTAALITRFGAERNETDKDEAQDALADLKQGSRTLQQYFEEARRIHRLLPQEDRRIAKNMVRGLNDELHRRITKGILASNGQTPALDKTIQIVRNVAEEKIELTTSDKLTAGNYEGIAAKDQKFLQLLAQQEDNRNKWEEKRMTLLVDSIAKLHLTNGNGKPPQTGGPPPQNRGYQGGQQTYPPNTGRNMRTNGPRTTTCYRCGGQGHYAPGCQNPPLSQEQQAKVREDVEARVRGNQSSNVEVQGQIPIDDEFGDYESQVTQDVALVDGANAEVEIDMADKRTRDDANLTGPDGPAKRTRTNAAATKRQPAQRRYIKGMQGHEEFSLTDTLRHTTINLSLMNLLNIAPQMRREIGKAVSLQPKQGASAGTGSDLTIGQQLVPNFYTRGTIHSRSTGNTQYQASKILIDGGSSVNLIAQQAIDKMNLTYHAGKPITIKVANGETQNLTWTAEFDLTIGSVIKPINAYIIPGQVSYTILLGRHWMRQVNAIGDYAQGRYFIKNQSGKLEELDAITPAIPVPTPRIDSGADIKRKIDNIPQGDWDALEQGDEAVAERMMNSLADGYDIDEDGEAIYESGNDGRL
ncbi:MAG: hsp70 nucleotide exchange factor fes1 [Chaenotheca gracillima]|nr:MAG: hsp70 nucleotide exchange factor fes1 [Chaenotheca gracillima]